MNAWAAGEACGRREHLAYGLEDRKGFVSENEEGVSGWGGSAQSQLYARPTKANAKCHVEQWQRGVSSRKESQDREVLKFGTPGRH